MPSERDGRTWWMLTAGGEPMVFIGGDKMLPGEDVPNNRVEITLFPTEAAARAVMDREVTDERRVYGAAHQWAVVPVHISGIPYLDNKACK